MSDPAPATPSRPFVPALGPGGRLGLYDAMTLLVGARPHRRLIAAADLAPHQTVLEIGCGTGNVLLAAARAEPAATVVGLDPDPAALARARHKTRRSPTITVESGYADELPHPDASVDRVLSAFMFHHLPAEQKLTMLLEVRRVLVPGGALLLLDVDGVPRPLGPLTPMLRTMSGHRGHRGHDGPNHSHHHEHVADGHDALTPEANDRRRIRELLTEAELSDPAQIADGRGALGAWTIHRAVRPRD